MTRPDETPDVTADARSEQGSDSKVERPGPPRVDAPSSIPQDVARTDTADESDTESKPDLLPDPQPKRERDRTWVWWFLIIAVAALVALGACAAKVDMIGDPRIVVHATSDAIVVQPASIIDFVQLARPRFGLHDAQRVFDGIRLDPPASADTLFASIGFTLDHHGPSRVALIQRFEVTPACQVSIEQMVDRFIRIDIRTLAADTTDDPSRACLISAELLLGSANGPDSLFARHSQDRRIEPARPASLQFRPRDPLRLRRFEVTGLGFTTAESGSPESAIRSAVISLPDHGVDRDTVLFGDRLTLGMLAGEVTEINVNNGIHTLFKGTASDPAIAGRRLKPSLLAQGFYTEDLRIILAIIVGFASVAMAIFQVVLKD